MRGSRNIAKQTGRVENISGVLKKPTENMVLLCVSDRVRFHLQHRRVSTVGSQLSPRQERCLTDEDIYGHRTKGDQTFIKSRFYAVPQPEASIVAERNVEKHRDTRRLLSHGFSLKSLKEQEEILEESLNLLVQQLRHVGDDGQRALSVKNVSPPTVMETREEKAHMNSGFNGWYST